MDKMLFVSVHCVTDVSSDHHQLVSLVTAHKDVVSVEILGQHRCDSALSYFSRDWTLHPWRQY